MKSYCSTLPAFRNLYEKMSNVAHKCPHFNYLTHFGQNANVQNIGWHLKNCDHGDVTCMMSTNFGKCWPTSIILRRAKENLGNKTAQKSVPDESMGRFLFKFLCFCLHFSSLVISQNNFHAPCDIKWCSPTSTVVYNEGSQRSYMYRKAFSHDVKVDSVKREQIKLSQVNIELNKLVYLCYS